MKKIAYILLVLLILSFSLISCVANVNEDADVVNSTVKVLLTDRPVSEVDSLWVYIKDFTYTYETVDGETVTSTPISIEKEYDILSLAGTETTLFNFEIPENSTLVNLKMTVKDATVTIAGEDHSVILMKSDILIPNVDINIGEGGELVLDFDVVRSLHQMGNNDIYKLSPVLKPTFRRGNANDLYLVKGNITDNSTPVSKAIVTISDDSTLLRITFSDKNGNFHLGKYKNGNYTINVYTNINLPDEDVDLDFSLYTPDATKIITIDNSDLDLNIDISKQN
ncbi:hypothetical protein XO12_06395 [Marinitoga sp. 1154]|uniref:DUF4382 domain-containing protein n=1 Tax=Marinitoga sp. 1154 TaxID=1643335 RepID=UPI00158600B4|nr:DUF4382 domain-containing protein [Marinitoga sp. 1154]NUU99741.1 hypothetical protein [Marinitoga sp. 1154]